jgi:hypothetical protein
MIFDLDIDDEIDLEPCIILTLLLGTMTVAFSLLYADISPDL